MSSKYPSRQVTFNLQSGGTAEVLCSDIQYCIAIPGGSAIYGDHAPRQPTPNIIEITETPVQVSDAACNLIPVTVTGGGLPTGTVYANIDRIRYPWDDSGTTRFDFIVPLRMTSVSVSESLAVLQALVNGALIAHTLADTGISVSGGIVTIADHLIVVASIQAGTTLDVTGNGTIGGTLGVTGNLSAANFSGTHSGTSSGTNTGNQIASAVPAVTSTDLSYADATGVTILGIGVLTTAECNARFTEIRTDFNALRAECTALKTNLVSASPSALLAT